MIRPVRFEFNAETAVNNSFQVPGQDANTSRKAAAEFDRFVELLGQQGVDVLVVNDTPEPHTPDSVFPNNWISFHEDGHLVLYPMFAPNRRQERKAHVLEAVGRRYQITGRTDLSGYEDSKKFLEGTGSMVLDRDNRIAYACLSPRTDIAVLNDFCLQFGYSALAFHAFGEKGDPIYHTNVLMCVADRYVVICMEAIPDEEEKTQVGKKIRESGKELLPISLQQMNQFAGNMLQVRNKNGQPLLVMSSSAYHSLNPDQVSFLQTFNPILHSSLHTIEKNGGGSARCMMAEIFLPPKENSPY